jgi:hypothetical protein
VNTLIQSQAGVAEVGVYVVVDSVAIAQEGNHEQLKKVNATELHSIVSFFCPNDECDPSDTRAKNYLTGTLVPAPPKSSPTKWFKVIGELCFIHWPC